MEQILDALGRLAGGDHDQLLPVSERHDELDAIAFGINLLVDELRFADRAKSVFVRNVSHELRTPVAAILASTELLAGAELDAAHRAEIVSRISRNASALLGLVDDLLDLARMEAGLPQVTVSTVDPVEVAHDVQASLASEATRRNLQLRCEIDPAAPRAIASDARRLRQILVNLVGNALKFTAAGQVTMRLAGGGGALTVEVIDTGIGLTQGQASTLFVPFQQADPSVARTYGGTGLGLALSRRYAQAMGGELTLASSQPGGGSTFRLVLPVGTPAPSPSVMQPQPRQLHGLSLLLVDDSDDIREAMADLLVFSGARVTQAADGLEAIDLCERRTFDVALVDLRMPGMDGLEVVRRLRQLGASYPLVALTADVTAQQRQECLAAGFDGFVEKPIEWSALVSVLARTREARR